MTENNFSCLLCDKGFTTKQSLLYHTSKKVCEKNIDKDINRDADSIISAIQEAFTTEQLKNILEDKKKVDQEKEKDIVIEPLNLKDDYFERTKKKFNNDLSETLSYLATISLSNKIFEADFRFVIKVLLEDIPTPNLPIRVVCLKKNKLQYYQDGQWKEDFRGIEVGRIISNNIRRALLIANRHYISATIDESDETKKEHLLQVYQFHKVATHALTLADLANQLKLSRLVASYIHDRVTTYKDKA